MPFGVTWSKRMSIEGGAGRRVEAAGGKLKHLVDLFARDVELLDDFVDRGASFEVFEYGGMRVLRNTHAPLRRPGTLSTAGHCDQSSVGILVTPFIVRFYHASTLASRSVARYCAPVSVIEAMGYVTKIKVQAKRAACEGI